MMSAEKLAPFKEMMLTLSHVGVSIPPLTPTTIDNDVNEEKEEEEKKPVLQNSGITSGHEVCGVSSQGGASKGSSTLLQPHPQSCPQSYLKPRPHQARPQPRPHQAHPQPRPHQTHPQPRPHQAHPQPRPQSHHGVPGRSSAVPRSVQPELPGTSEMKYFWNNEAISTILSLHKKLQTECQQNYVAFNGEQRRSMIDGSLHIKKLEDIIKCLIESQSPLTQNGLCQDGSVCIRETNSSLHLEGEKKDEAVEVCQAEERSVHHEVVIIEDDEEMPTRDVKHKLKKDLVQVRDVEEMEEGASLAEDTSSCSSKKMDDQVHQQLEEGVQGPVCPPPESLSVESRPPDTDFIWSYEATKTLLSLWKEECTNESYKSRANGTLTLDAMSKYMRSMGFQVTSVQCQQRIDSLTHSYYQAIRDSARVRGVEPKYPYINEVENILRSSEDCILPSTQTDSDENNKLVLPLTWRRNRSVELQSTLGKRSTETLSAKPLLPGTTETTIYRWGHEATQTLVSAYKKISTHSLKDKLYKKIAKSMQRSGYALSAKQCQNKLAKIHSKMKLRNLQTSIRRFSRQCLSQTEPQDSNNLERNDDVKEEEPPLEDSSAAMSSNEAGKRPSHQKESSDDQLVQPHPRQACSSGGRMKHQKLSTGLQRWPHEAVQLLAYLWQKAYLRSQKSKTTVIMTYQTFQKIAKSIRRSTGCDVTAVQCMKKIGTLTCLYRKDVGENRIERGKKPKCPVFNELNRVFKLSATYLPSPSEPPLSQTNADVEEEEKEEEVWQDEENSDHVEHEMDLQVETERLREMEGEVQEAEGVLEVKGVVRVEDEVPEEDMGLEVGEREVEETGIVREIEQEEEEHVDMEVQEVEKVLKVDREVQNVELEVQETEKKQQNEQEVEGVLEVKGVVRVEDEVPEKDMGLEVGKREIEEIEQEEEHMDMDMQEVEKVLEVDREVLEVELKVQETEKMQQKEQEVERAEQEVELELQETEKMQQKDQEVEREEQEVDVCKMEKEMQGLDVEVEQEAEEAVKEVDEAHVAEWVQEVAAEEEEDQAFEKEAKEVKDDEVEGVGEEVLSGEEANAINIQPRQDNNGFQACSCMRKALDSNVMELMKKLQKETDDREDARQQRLLEHETRMEERRECWEEQRREREEQLRREEELWYRYWDDQRREREFQHQRHLLQLFLQGFEHLGQPRISRQ